MDFSVKKLVNAKCHHAEGPFWDHQSKVLYWVEIL
jgi:sugar lactone lactonase YvrE